MSAAALGRDEGPLALVPPAPAPAHGAAGAVPAAQLLAEFSHDLRTPLASLRLLVGALRDGLVEPARRDDHLASIEHMVSLMTELVDELHSVAREEASGSRTEWISPRGLIVAAADTLRIQAEAGGVVLEFDVPPCLPTIRGNRVQLHRALVNLLENAIRHARNGGSVAVHAQPALGGVEIEVEDDGEGIAAEERAAVFTAFYGRDRRGSEARSGLGLAIAHAIVDGHGGRIWLAESAAGTRVRLSLPGRVEELPVLDAAHAAQSKF
ncbi:MAG: HAMP domain-containing histidine kinase [Solirubrobacterales bacterium]|nr:HAMP domain-containing histidine kinase [Solirubrobacterales bacterium]